MSVDPAPAIGGAWKRPSARRRAAAPLVLVQALIAAPLAAQQYITDDAAITEHRACQI